MDQKYSTLPDGRIYRWVRIAPGEKGRKAVKGHSPEEVEAKAREILAAAEPSPGPSEVFAPGTFGHFIYNVYCPRTYKEARATTRDLYDVYLRLHILPILGDMPIRSVGYAEMEHLESTLMNTRVAKGKPPRPLGKKTKREVLMRVREALNLYGQLEKGQGSTVREDWRVHKPPKAKKKKERQEVGADYSVKLLEAASGTWLEGPLYCVLFLMLRRGEVCGMKTKALDRSRQRIRVTEQSHPRLAEGSTPKGDKKRDIPVPKEVFDAIERLRSKDSIYLWTKDGLPIPPDEFSHAVPDLCVSAGLERKTPHELRALGATNLLSIGTNPVAVMEILGHAQLDTSLIYFDPRAQEKRDAFAALLGGTKPVDEIEDVG